MKFVFIFKIKFDKLKDFFSLIIKVVNLEGQTISFGRATGRYFASYLSGFIFFLGYLIQLCNQRRQTLHDIIVKTIVVKV